MKSHVPTTRYRQGQFCHLVKIIFTMLDDDPKEICNATGLSLSTVRRWMAGEASMCGQVNTLDVLCRAAGLNLNELESILYARK